MNVVLVGYRGTGKSTIGRLVADRLGMRYVGLDDEIVRRAGRSIPEIVESDGWPAFRELEAEVTRDASAVDGCVIDTGGGVVLRDDNVEALRRTGTVFLLVATIDDIVARISGDTQRPSLTGARSFTDEVAEVLREREPRYRAAAHHVIDTSVLQPDVAVEQIVRSFEATGGAP